MRLDYLRELLFVPDSAIFWIRPVVRLGQKIAARRRIDVIYTSVKPHSVAIAGWLLKKRLGKPWVIDFRDPWTQYFLAEFPTRLHYTLEQMLERFLLRRADHIVTITPTARAQLLQWCSFLSPEKVTVITNGYDDEDFDRVSSPAVERNGSFSFVYSGVFCGAPQSGSRPENPLLRAWRSVRRLLAYSPRAFDRLTHSPKFLLDALNELFRDNPALRGKVKLVHIGPFDESNREYVRKLGIPDAVEARGYVTHREAVDVVSKADALFFCLADSPLGERNDCVPQKVYEYLGSRRPVLALAPVGDARDFLNQAGTAIVCSPRDLSEIKAGILSMLDGTDRLKPNEEFIQSFRRRELTRQLAAVFDRVCKG